MYQLDFLPIGEKQCGEAIVLRFGDLASGDPRKQTVILIDGGYTDDSQKIVNLIKTHYQTDFIDLMISTHPDQDHISGLPGVFDEMRVGQLWMHRPWLHSETLSSSKASNFSLGTLRSKKLEKALQGASELEQAADAHEVPIVEPFTDEIYYEDAYGRLTVLGPSRQYYDSLVPAFLESKKAVALPSLVTELQRAIRAAQNILESHDRETLTNFGKTSPQNNSSTIMLLEVFGDNPKKVLFTGDAGMPALGQAHERYTTKGYLPGELDYIQVPHHGSRKNVGPDILDKFLGQRTDSEDTVRGKAIVSVATTCDVHGHPKKVVTNAFRRRGYPVHATAGSSWLFHAPGLNREGWDPAAPLPHFAYVEPDND